MNFIKDTIEYIRQLLTFWIEVMPWERGIRVKLGKSARMLTPGIWVKLPVIHRVYIQSVRLRVIDTPIQTVTTKNGSSMTIRMSIGYEISDIVKLFNSIHQIVETVSNIAQGAASTVISESDLEPQSIQIQNAVVESLKGLDYGLSFCYVRITTYAKVRTFRLIGDHNWAASDGEVITIKT